MEIVWQDKDIVVVNKPAGVAVDEVGRWAALNLDLQGLDKEPMKTRSGLAHRLDKETSGLLLIAKNSVALVALMDQFKRRVIKKEYLALVHGRLEPKEGVVRLPIGRSGADRRRQEVHFAGKQSETAWEVEKYFPTRPGLVGFSLVRVRPKTGRMHQIRVHLAHLGHPIFADEKYGGRKARDKDRKQLKHHFLHAVRVGFFDMGGVWQTVEVGLPGESKVFLDRL